MDVDLVGVDEEEHVDELLVGDVFDFDLLPTCSGLLEAVEEEGLEVLAADSKYAFVGVDLFVLD